MCIALTLYLKTNIILLSKQCIVNVHNITLFNITMQFLIMNKSYESHSIKHPEWTSLLKKKHWFKRETMCVCALLSFYVCQ